MMNRRERQCHILPIIIRVLPLLTYLLSLLFTFLLIQLTVASVVSVFLLLDCQVYEKQ